MFFMGTQYHGFSLVFLLPSIFLLIPNTIKLSVFTTFEKLIAIVLFAGLLTYLLRFVVNLPSFSISPLNDLRRFNAYYVYLFDVTQRIGIFPRFYSIFDEPGIVGTLCALLISYKPLSIKGFNNRMILLAGFFSFSLAFYSILLINYIYNLNIKYAFFVLIISVFYLVFIPEDNLLNTIIFSRLKIVEGTLSGDNRVNPYFATNYNNFVTAGGKDLWFGRGVGAAGSDDYRNAGSNSYKVIIYQFGIIGIMLYLLFFISVTFLIAPSRRGFFYLLVFILLAYQRINVLLLYNIAVFTGGLLYIYKYSDKQKQTHNKSNKITF